MRRGRFECKLTENMHNLNCILNTPAQTYSMCLYEVVFYMPALKNETALNKSYLIVVYGSDFICSTIIKLTTAEKNHHKHNMNVIIYYVNYCIAVPVNKV